MNNSFEEIGRLKKATAIADVLHANDYQSHVVASFNDYEWGLAASAAGYTRRKPPSDETRALVIKLMRQREQAPRLTVDQINERIQEAMDA